MDALGSGASGVVVWEADSCGGVNNQKDELVLSEGMNCRKRK